MTSKLKSIPLIKFNDYLILIDSGSDINLISPNIVKQRNLKIIQKPITFKTAQGKVRCKDCVEIKIQNKKFEFFIHEFHKESNMLFGVKILEHCNTLMDFKNKTITFGNRKFKLLSSHTLNNSYIQFRHEHLTYEQKEKIKNLIEKYSSLFPKPDEELSATNVTTHKIRTTDDTPVFQKNYRLPQIYEADIEEHIQNLLKTKVIQKSKSPYNSPIWIVPKKMDASGKRKTRLVIDFRKLNQKTIEDKFPLPNIDTLLDHIGKPKFFTTLDLHSGFHQILINENDQEKTAFSTASGHYEFVRMPFGLINAPASFQRMMNEILSEYINKICLVYMDDIIILGNSLEEHLENIEKIFSKLQNANLKIQIDKSEFLKTETEYLGFIISKEGLKPNKKKTEAIEKILIPKTVKEIKSFLGKLSWYRRFIPNFAKLTKPFTECLKKNKQIDITNKDYQNSFKTAKELISNPPILEFPDFSKKFILTTDASDYAMGSVISQIINGQEKPVAYASKTFNSAEQNYSTIEKELKSIIWSIDNFKPYLFGRKFTIRTDHKPLTWLFSMKNANQKLMRWKIELGEYNFDIEYLPGKTNKIADFLSRQRDEFKIENKLGDVTDTDIFAHCISKDLKFGKGLARQINEKFNSKNYCERNINNKNVIIQNIENKTIFHLITKDIYSEDVNRKYLKKTLTELRDYLIKNDVYEINIPYLSCGLDKLPKLELIKILECIFNNTQIKINLYEQLENFSIETDELDQIVKETLETIYNNDEDEQESIIVNESESGNTIHSSSENPVNGLKFIDNRINVAKNQIIFHFSNNPFEIKVNKIIQPPKTKTYNKY